MFVHQTQIRVRYAETDKMGFVYYGNYPAYYEVARVEAFRSIEVPYKEIEDNGTGMPVLSMDIQYHQPARYDDLLTIKLTIPEEPRARIKFLYEIRNETGKLINTGETILAFINMETGRPTKMPQRLEKSITSFFNNKHH